VSSVSAASGLAEDREIGSARSLPHRIGGIAARLAPFGLAPKRPTRGRFYERDGHRRPVVNRRLSISSAGRSREWHVAIAIEEPLKPEHDPMSAVSAFSINAGRLLGEIAERRRRAGRGGTGHAEALFSGGAFLRWTLPSSVSSDQVICSPCCGSEEVPNFSSSSVSAARRPLLQLLNA
jgi:hypothetical protein